MPSVAPQRSRQLGPGDKLGKYEVIRQIAIGGMAELYLARTLGIEGFEKLVVVKRILPQYVANATFVNMFLNEARIAATLHHPNVAQVYDIGLDEGDYFFAMEYVHGEDLDHISIASEEQGVPISLDAALTLAAGLCAGLHYAHERVSVDGKPQQIVHRDVSPSNVLVSYDGAVKLVDFGIARAASRPGTTATGGLKGKIAYMSPEQCKAKATLDRRTDIYAVGTLLYELTTGQLPFSGETEYQILNQIVNEDVPRPSTIVPDYPPALEAILLKALARDPDARYRSALEMQGAIEDFAHDTRLRISPLVLGRLMGTLFPARLEEWDHAKKQGAFFVEQHVVRTLIESGKTPDPNDPDIKAAMLAAEARQKAAEEAARRVIAAAGDDDTTTVNHSLTDLGGDTNIGPPPISTLSMEPTIVDTVPLPPQPLVVNIIQPATATPPGGNPYAAQAGTLFSSSQSSPRVPAGVVEPTPPVADITEQVRVPSRRQSSPTILIRTKSKKPPYI
ncbi:MAG TPA: serine/threonine-protein kinase, partial [Kofleriaceae bacterium]|nr:serine/threonine-protein kinase [Kofleriaceae bacterium]